MPHRSTTSGFLSSVGRHRGTAARLLSVALALSIGGCAENSSATEKPTQAAPVGKTDLPEVLATIGDENVTLADIRGRTGERLDQLDTQYRLTRDKMVGAALDSILRERLLAAESKARKKTPDELLLAEMGGNSEPTEVEIAAWYGENRARLGGRSLDQVKLQIADYLRKERRFTAAAKLEERLRNSHRVTVAFEPYRLEFSNEGAPTLGKEGAPVTLVEFSDFQCPYCRAAAPTLKQVAEKFGDQVHIVYRQYPITSIHPNAFKAAEASLCAHDQGKFWEMHDAMFADQNKLAVSDLKQTAVRLGLDSKKFDACLDSGRYVERVQNDIKEALRIGANGTPALFINGTYVEGGSVPFQVLEGLIQKELARAKPRG